MAELGRLLQHLREHAAKLRVKSARVEGVPPTSFDAGCALAPHQREALRQLFILWCGSAAGAVNSPQPPPARLPLEPCLHLFRGAGLLTARLGLAQLAQLFHQQAAGCAQGVDFEGWLALVGAGAGAQYPLLPPPTAVAQLADELAAGMHPCRPEASAAADPCLTELFSNSVCSLLADGANAGLLKALFERYSSVRGGAASSSASGAASSTRAAAAGQSGGEPLVTEQGLALLARELALCPKQLTLLELLACAHHAKPATWRGRDPKHPVPLRVPEFLEALLRVSLVAYDWQPPAQPPVTAAFAGSYSSAAKHAWVQGWQQAAGTTSTSSCVLSATGKPTAKPGHLKQLSTAWVGSPAAAAASHKAAAGDGAQLATQPPFENARSSALALSRREPQLESTARRAQEVEQSIAAALRRQAAEELAAQTLHRSRQLSALEEAASRRRELEHRAGQDVVKARLPLVWNVPNPTRPLTQELLELGEVWAGSC